MMILPIVKSCFETDALCSVPEKLTYSYDSQNESARLGAEAFSTFESKAVFSSRDGFINFVFDASLEEKSEIYSVTVLENKIIVGFRDQRGAINGAATLSLLLRKTHIKQCKIIDFPSCSYRSLMIDMASGLPSFQDIECAIKYMALAKFNRLHLHLIDSKGPCFKLDTVPKFMFTGKGGQCEKEFLSKIISLCKNYAIEIIPEIDLTAHSFALCRAYPEFKCDLPHANGWVVCPGNEDVWVIFEKLIKEVADIFVDSKYIHVGTDELEFPDTRCFWDECPRCETLRKKNGLKNKREEFYYVIERLHDIVRGCGKKMIMWNDQIDVSKDVPLSRDILIQFWRIAADGCGPNDDCDFEKLLEKGFSVINSYFLYAYLDEEGYISSQKMKDWTPFTHPEQSTKYAKQIVGGEACAWGFGNYDNYPFYACSIPPSIALFGDKLWSLGVREHNHEFKVALSEFVFGSNNFTEVFEYIGDFIPPREKDKLTYVEPKKISKQAVLKCCDRLKSTALTPAAVNFANRLEAIAKLI